MADAPRVFLSYSHDSDEHAARVLDLANALRRDGSNVLLDRYLQPRGPEEGWPLWMDQNICDADFVLMICTATYLRRVLGEEKPGQGLGVRWESKLIYNRIYHDQPSGSRFIPILLPGSVLAHIPTPVLGHDRYEIASFSRTDRGYDGLYRHLMNKPEVIAPKIGTLGEPVVWNVPYPQNRNFTGREAILAQLEAALASGTPAALRQAIAGLGGVGKTQTAVEYAYRHHDRYRAVLWVRAGTETDLVSGYRELAEVLSLAVKDARDSTEVVGAVRRWLGREPGYLLILDNADDPALVRPYLPPEPKGHVLLTSRAQNFDTLGIREPTQLPVLEPDEALAFLLKRTDRKGPLDPAEQDAARTLAGELGYLPLALEQAAAYMVGHEEPFSVYLTAYRALRLKLLDEMGPVAGEYPKYPETVRTTWKRNFDAVAAVSPASIALLRLSAFFAPYPIPYEVILEGASELGEPLAPALASPAGGEYALNKLLTPLARHSLVRRDPEARTYSVHRLVQAVLLDELTAATRKDLAERAVKALERTFPDVGLANWPRCERLVSHALAARGWIESEDLFVPAAAQLLNEAGYYLYVRARYAEAEPLYRRALVIDEAVLGPGRLETALILNNLAVLLRNRGSYTEGEELCRRALAIREAVLGPDHPDTAISLINLALLLQAQGRYAEAERPLRQGLAIREKVLGPDHPDIAQSLNDLAILFQAQGRLGEAEPLYRRALAIWEKAPGVGRDHPDTARGLDNLAYLLRAQGRLGEAEPLYRRALAIREKALGPDQPDTLTTRHHIAHWTGEAGDAREALRLCRKLLPDQERVHGPDHPDTLGTRHSIAHWTGEAGDARAALRLYLKLLPDRERVQRPDHPDTLTTRHSIAHWTARAGDAHEALRLLRELLPDRERVQGPDHPDTLLTRHDIARWTGEAGDAREALRLCRELLPDRRHVLGPDHPDTLTTRHSIARWTARAGDAREALRLYCELLPDRRHVLGPDHPDTLTTRHHIAHWTGEAGDARGAAAVLRIAPGPGARPRARPPRHADDAPPHRPLDRRDCPPDRQGGGRARGAAAVPRAAPRSGTRPRARPPRHAANAPRHRPLDRRGGRARGAAAMPRAAPRSGTCPRTRPPLHAGDAPQHRPLDRRGGGRRARGAAAAPHPAAGPAARPGARPPRNADDASPHRPLDRPGGGRTRGAAAVPRAAPRSGTRPRARPPRHAANAPRHRPRHFGIAYHVEHVRKLIRWRFRWSSQKPQKQAKQRDAEAIAR